MLTFKGGKDVIVLPIRMIGIAQFRALAIKHLPEEKWRNAFD